MKSVIKIKENRDFRRAYAKGKALVCPYAVVYVLKNRCDNIRLGITTGKKIGNAVKRNRAKRVIRAAFITVEGANAGLHTNYTGKGQAAVDALLKEGYDFVIVARTRLLTVKSTAVSDSIRGLLEAVEICEKR